MDERRKPFQRYRPFGERFEHAEDLSPSARKALEKYMEEAGKIIKARREDGGIDWENALEDTSDIYDLDCLEDYDPLFLEQLFLDEQITSARKKRPSILRRDETGEIMVTPEGAKQQTDALFKAMEKAAKELDKAPKDTEERLIHFAGVRFFLYSQAPIFHPRAISSFFPDYKTTAKPEAVPLLSAIADRYLVCALGLGTATFTEPEDECPMFQKTTGTPPPQAMTPISSKEPLDVIPSSSTILESLNGVRFASSPFFIREGFRSVCNPSFWQNAPKGYPFYRPPKEKKITYLIARKDQAGTVQALPGDEAWRIVQTLGVKTGLLHIQFAAYCMESEKPWACFARADGDALIKLLRLNEEKKLDPETGKRRRLSRVEQLQELEGHLKSLRAIHVDVRSKPDRDGTIWKTDEPEPLWDVSILRRTQGTLEEIEGLDVAVDLNVHVRAGRWAMHESGKDTGLHYSYLSKSVLEFNPKTEDWAIKLGVFTSCFAPYREHRFIVRTLLENLLKPEEITSMENPSGDKRKRNNTANKLESTLAAMEERGWTVERSPEYIAAMGNGEGRRSRNFFPRLLESRLELTPPPVSGQKSLPKEKKTLGNGDTFSGKKFMEQRIKMGLTRTEAARALGRSKTLIYYIETGQRRISPEDAKAWEKLRKRFTTGGRTTPD